MRILLGTAAALAFALPALAQDATDYSTVTCADFSAMDEAGMMSAYEGMTASMAAGDMASTDAASTDAAASGTDMASADATASTDTASTDTASTDTAAADAGAMDPMMTALSEACTSDPSMLAMDAMTQAQGTMEGGMGATDDAATESSGG